MVGERTRHRYAALSEDADPADTERMDRISGTEMNVAGIMHWLDKLGRAGARPTRSGP